MKLSVLGGVLVWLGFCLPFVESAFILPINFKRWFFQSSIVVGSRLYIDGGEAQDDAPNALATTLVIDLSKDWTNDSIPVTYIDKPSEFPLAKRPFLWTNTGADTIYAYGGAPYYLGDAGNSTYFRTINSSGVTPPLTIPDNPSSYRAPIQSIWKLQLNSDKGGQWTRGVDPASSNGINPTFGSSQVTAGGTIVVAGGFMTTPDWNFSEKPGFVVPGVLTANVDNQASWTNSTTSGFDIGTVGGSSYLAWGQAIYSPVFGSKGIVIYFGGYSPDTQVVGSVESSDNGGLWNMANIVIFDVASSTWHQQQASGDIPLGRFSFCAVGISDAAESTFDIFVHGGEVVDGVGDPFQDDLSNIFVLTLPSFVWTRVPNTSTAVNRANHVCAVIGERQMAVIGGVPRNGKGDVDPWSNSIGVFDMSALSWSSRYSASAAQYERHALLSNVTEKTPAPGSWNSPALQTIFQTTRSSSGGEANSPKSSTGSIVGGAVGGAAALLAILAAITLYWRAHRRRQTNKVIPDGDGPFYPGPGSVPIELEAPALEPHEKSTGYEAHEIGSSMTQAPWYWDKKVSHNIRIGNV